MIVQKTAAGPQFFTSPNDRAVQETELFATAALMRAVEGTGTPGTRVFLQTAAFPDPCITASDTAYISRVIS